MYLLPLEWVFVSQWPHIAQDNQKVKKLLSFGGMALLGERIMPDKDILHSYEMP